MKGLFKDYKTKVETRRTHRRNEQGVFDTSLFS